MSFLEFLFTTPFGLRLVIGFTLGALVLVLGEREARRQQRLADERSAEITRQVRETNAWLDAQHSPRRYRG